MAKLFDFERVASGIYGAIAKQTAMLNCNAAVIVNRDHVLVVDTHSKPSAAKALIQQIRDEITELPVRYVVDSHLHGDHAMGNEAYPEVFGASVDVISSVKTREWLEKLGVSRMQETLDGLPKEIAELRSRLEKSRDEAERAALKIHIEGIEAYLREMQPGASRCRLSPSIIALSSTAADARSTCFSSAEVTRPAMSLPTSRPSA